MNRQWIVGLRDGAEGTLALVGGKALNLRKLASMGMPVPDGFCLTTECYREFVAANGIAPVIASSLAAFEQAGAEAKAQAVSSIRNAFLAGTFPKALAMEIEAAYSAFPATAVAVRSSATAEDLAGASFAGGQATILDVSTLPALFDSIRQCWASLWTERVMAYRRRLVVNEENLALAVVVQQMVRAQVSGVLFTVEPVSGNREIVALDACRGLGEALVSGNVTPDHFELDRATLAPRNRPSKPCLTVPQVQSVARLGLRIEREFGAPQDIEWSINASGQVFVLQARPITTLAAAATWENPVPGAVWVRSGCGGLVEYLPAPVSPLYATAQIPRIMKLHDAQCPEMGVLTPQPTSTIINGHFYSRQDWSFSLGIFRLPFTYWRSANGTAVRWREQVLPVQRRELAALAQFDIAAASAGELLRFLENVIAHNARAWDDAVRASRAWVVTEPVYRRVFQSLIKPVTGGDPVNFLRGFRSRVLEGERALWNLTRTALLDPKIDQALRDGTPEEALQRLSRLPAASQWMCEFDAYRAEFGHAAANQDYLFASIADDAPAGIAAIRARMDLPLTDPAERQQSLAANRELALAAAMGKLDGNPIRRRLFTWALGHAQPGAAIREDVFFHALEGWPIARRAFLAMGRRLAECGVISAAEDIFFLTWGEVREAVETGLKNDLTARSTERRERHKLQSQLNPPLHVPIEGPPQTILRKCKTLLKRMIVGSSKQSSKGVLRGSPVSPGQVTGPARILRSCDEFSRLRAGDIVITRAATPEWTPTFAVAAGLVADTGGPLSHSSIIAREFGIPAIMGAACATSAIAEGQMITIDGSEGIIRMHELTEEKK